MKKIHESGKRFDCKLCPESFYSMVSFIAHKKEKHSNIWKPRECPECGVMLENARMSNKHFRLVHLRKPKQDPSNNRRCVLCGLEFETIKLYIEHKYQHFQYTKDELRNYGIEKIYPCKICNTQVSSWGSIVTHMANHLDKTHECQYCHEKFSYFVYKRHMRHFHNEVTCNLCKEVFLGR